MSDFKSADRESFIWMLDEEKAPSHMTISNFIHKELSSSLEDIFNDINSDIFGRLGVDLERAYIDGTKIEANANRYTWVWKKSCIKSRNNVFGKLSSLLEEVNAFMGPYQRAVFELRQEYTIEYAVKVNGGSHFWNPPFFGSIINGFYNKCWGQAKRPGPKAISIS